MAAARHEPYLWVTWITGVLAGDRQCLLAPWLKAHFRITKVERSGFDLAAWTVAHTDMVRTRARELEAEGYTVLLEDQNAFTIRGQHVTLAGKCDLVAERGDEVRLVDCKSGQARGADVQQVLVYLLALPLLRPALREKRLTGELQYAAHRLEVPPEAFTPALRQRILDTIKSIGSGPRPVATPSAAECRWCDVSAADCPDRIEQPEPAVLTTTEW